MHRWCSSVVSSPSSSARRSRRRRSAKRRSIYKSTNSQTRSKFFCGEWEASLFSSAKSVKTRRDEEIGTLDRPEVPSSVIKVIYACSLPIARPHAQPELPHLLRRPQGPLSPRARQRRRGPAGSLPASLSLSLSLSLSPNTACILGSVPLRWRRNGCAQAKEIRKLVEVTRGYIEKLNVRPPVQLKEPPPHTNALTQQIDQSRTFHPFCTPSAPLLHPCCPRLGRRSSVGTLLWQDGNPLRLGPWQILWWQPRYFHAELDGFCHQPISTTEVQKREKHPH